MLRESLAEEFKEVIARTSSTFPTKNSALLVSIQRWQLYQMKFMPGIPEWEPLLAAVEMNEDELAFEVPLMLPSDIEEDIRTNVCAAGVIEEELAIRETIAFEVLGNIRRLLLQESVKKKQKRKFHSGPGQGLKTQYMQQMERLDKERNREVMRYRETRKRLTVLQKDGPWSEKLQVLETVDIRAPERNIKMGESEGRRTQTWIWEMPGASLELNSSLEESRATRAEWARSRARRNRWVEDEALVKEEMKRVLTFFRWKATSWIERAKNLSTSTDEVDMGAVTYANRQVIILQTMAKTFREKWLKHSNKLELPVLGNLDILHCCNDTE